MRLPNFYFSLLILSVAAAPQTEILTNLLTSGGRRYDCKCYPGDKCWPLAAKWTALNNAVGGALKEVVPEPAVCYNTFEGKPTYNAAQCAEVTSKFTNQFWATDTQVGNLWTFWTNNTCWPTTNPSDTCTIGYFPEYVIMATKKEHIKAGIDFARENNVRLVIRNTGHDFMGRSTGFGSLAINTHSFKDVKFIQKYTGPGNWKGSAVTVGAGIQGRELLRLGFQQNPKVAIVTGECPVRTNSVRNSCEETLLMREIVRWIRRRLHPRRRSRPSRIPSRPGCRPSPLLRRNNRRRRVPHRQRKGKPRSLLGSERRRTLNFRSHRFRNRKNIPRNPIRRRNPPHQPNPHQQHGIILERLPRLPQSFKSLGE